MPEVETTQHHDPHVSIRSTNCDDRRPRALPATVAWRRGPGHTRRAGQRRRLRRLPTSATTATPRPTAMTTRVMSSGVLRGGMALGWPLRPCPTEFSSGGADLV